MTQVLKNKKGVTLVELLAVIVIMGIIAAIAVPAIGGLIENSRVKAAEAVLVSIEEAARLAVIADDLPTTSATAGEVSTELATYVEWNGYVLTGIKVWNDNGVAKFTIATTATLTKGSTESYGVTVSLDGTTLSLS